MICSNTILLRTVQTLGAVSCGLAKSFHEAILPWGAFNGCRTSLWAVLTPQTFTALCGVGWHGADRTTSAVVTSAVNKSQPMQFIFFHNTFLIQCHFIFTLVIIKKISKYFKLTMNLLLKENALPQQDFPNIPYLQLLVGLDSPVV